MENFFIKNPEFKKELKFKNSKGELINITSSGSLFQLVIGYRGLMDYRIKRMKDNRLIPIFKLEE